MLKLCDCKVADIMPLSALHSLQALDIDKCRPACRSLRFLSPLTGLQSLRITCSKNLTNLSPLSNLTSLSRVDILGARKVRTHDPGAPLGPHWAPVAHYLALQD